MTFSLMTSASGNATYTLHEFEEYMSWMESITSPENCRETFFVAPSLQLRQSLYVNLTHSRTTSYTTSASQLMHAGNRLCDTGKISINRNPSCSVLPALYPPQAPRISLVHVRMTLEETHQLFHTQPVAASILKHRNRAHPL